MAQWAKVVRLPQGPLLDQLKSLYGPKFPIEVRHYLAKWIETQSWGEVDPDNPHCEPEGRRLFEGMLQALQDLITTYATDFLTRTQLEALYAHMRNEYIQQPLALVRYVQHCLCSEAELLEKLEQLNAPSPLARQPITNTAKIQQLIQNIVTRTENMEGIFRNLSSKLESFMLQYQEALHIEAALHQGNRIPPDQLPRYKERKQLLDQMLRKEAEGMKRTCADLGQRFVEYLEEVRTVQSLVVTQELANWQQSQRMFNWEDDRGKAELNTLQQWFEAIAELLWRTRLLSKQFELLKTRIPQGIIQGDQYGTVPQLLTNQLVELIKSSFVLEKQPPQVIKTANRFSSIVRLLVGSKLQIHLGVPEVTVTIINAQQAKAIAADPTKPMPSSGDILNNQKAMEYNSQTGVLSCAFNFMQLKRIKRNSDKKATEMVTEEKFTLLFRTHFTVGGGEIELAVKTQSLPVVVIVHVTQQPPAEATIFWDNSFAETNREPFIVPDSVPWPQLSEALNCFFHSHCGRGLTPQNLDYLGRKLLGCGPEEDLNQMSVSRQQLCKEQLRGRNFTFWEWFYKHLDLIKTTLKREWMEGSIQGFMQKAEAEKLLHQCPVGTFLIRFSEGEPGGISVAWGTEGDVLLGERQVLSLSPWNKHELGTRAFADRLHDLTHLLFVYPNKPKDEVFGKYYTPPPPTETADGYVPAGLKTAVDMPSHVTRSFSSNPASPAPSLVSMTSNPLSPPWPPGMGMNGLDLSALDFNPGSIQGASYDSDLSMLGDLTNSTLP